MLRRGPQADEPGPDADRRKGTGLSRLQAHVYEQADSYALYATPQWSEGGVQHQRIRSISIRSVPDAAWEIAGVMAEANPDYDDTGREEIADLCEEALLQTIDRIYKAGRYPTDNGRSGDRYEAIASFVEGFRYLPL